MDRQHIRIEITPGACIGAAFSILILPGSWIISACTAALIHELAHIAALKLCGVRIYDITVGGFGAKIRTEPMRDLQELLCAAAGPIGSLSLLLISGYFPLIALFGFFHGVCNLLPIFPLDGGRMFHAILRIAIPKHARSVMNAVELCTLSVIGVMGIFIFRHTKQAHLFILGAAILILRTLKRKIPCKEGQMRVQ